jgi:DNA-binding LytR/AlgR family response regulator
MTIAFSQLLIRTFVPVKEFRYSHFFLWTLSEILLASLVVASIFADYSQVFFHEFLITLRYIPVGLLLPYAFSMLILMLLQQKSRWTAAAAGAAIENPDLVHIKDEREQVKFSVRKDYILYLESADNYVTIYYLPEGEVQKEMVRTSMKKMETFLRPYGLVRCHRSFMVNLGNVQWMKKKGRNYQIKMKNCQTIIPVSRGYHSMVRSLV